MRKSACAGLAVVTLLVSAACTVAPVETPTGTSSSVQAITVGSPTPDSSIAPESQIVAEIYTGALTAAGVPAVTKPDSGTRDIYLTALQDGSVDVVPDYSGSLLSHADPGSSEVSADDIYKALTDKLPEGLAVLEASKAESKDAMVVTKATAEKYQLKSIEDLAKVCKDVAMAAPATFETRPDGVPGLKASYGCEFKALKPFNDGGGNQTLLALLTDDVQVADISTSTPSISDNDLVVLEDPKNNFKAQQVLPVYNKARMSDKAKEALNAVSRILTTDDLVNLNRAASGSQKQNAKDAATAWLKDKGIVK
ncbi:osmoprotectant transport system substrate-binding protein [Arthrobacter pascens]|uniref:ABC transporter substrate-binding protein n=1 Tax=Arthrobacter pascens TaxID=1677 RepID=UPI00278EE50D|nr:ABC transporter substrate-binding protein [Arthrobacter pascens]MDQ0677630.1 osmoprotectant transport system substrate-binding protein [Arthrobacter pascens]